MNKNSQPSEQTGVLTRLFKHSAIYAVSTSLQRLQGLLLLPIYTSFSYIPSRSEFGNFVLVYTFIAFMNFFYLYGMDSALLRFFFLGKASRKTVFSSAFLLLLVSSIITTALVVIFSDAIAAFILSEPQLGYYIQLAAIILLIDSLINLPFLILRAEEKPLQFTGFKALRFLLEFSLNIVFVVILRKGVLGILYANIIASAINFLIMLPIVFRYFQFKIDWQLAKEMLWFGLPFLPNGIAYMTIEMVDRILVENILGKDAVGLYSANYKFGTILLFLVVAFRNAWQPFFLKIADQPDARVVFSRVFTYFLMGAGFVILGVTFFIGDILTIHYFGKFYLFGPQYWQGIPLIPLILISYLFFGLYVILTPGFYIRKKSKYMILFTGSAAIINIVANVILLPHIDIWGAAVATLLSYFTMAFTIYLVTRRIYPLPIEWQRVLKIFSFIATGYLLYYFFNPSFLVRVGFLLIFLYICYFYILYTEERRTLKAQLAAILSGL